MKGNFRIALGVLVVVGLSLMKLIEGSPTALTIFAGLGLIGLVLLQDYTSR